MNEGGTDRPAGQTPDGETRDVKARNGGACDVDVFIVGGGINGAGIARDAVGRGFSVALCEMNDLASGTSSASTKLIHGGLRYLEHYEFRLVREALMEREVLWAAAPHIIWPLHFVLPHQRAMRPKWLLRLGLFLYDHIGGPRHLPGTRVLNLRTDPAGAPLKPEMRTGFEYSDCWVQDARLTVLNARDAADRGATILVRTECVGLTRAGDHWEVRLRDHTDGTERTMTARLVVNAAGPWVDRLLHGPLGRPESHNVRLVQGSHIVVPRVFDHDRCYIFQNPDGRIIFAIPYEDKFTLIGTTDHEYHGDPGAVRITPEETEYLCSAASAYFRAPITPDQVVWSYSGVRPLFDDGAGKAQEATRDYVLRADPEPGAPLLNIFGGKITTYRRLAESMLTRIEEHLGRRGGPWTHDTPLPGGAFPKEGFDTLVGTFQAAYPGLPAALLRRLARAYGTDTPTVLGEAHTTDDLGHHFGADLYEVEVRFLMDREWARTAEDVLWRRSKLGLRLTAAEAAALEDWIARPQ
ncbi:glycerol-3-phosphate dehydrogenase [Roseospira marina]|uniref:Glycerol-3-phosphate dehydrogenase n=1 Tax=Roseospira marina TaxID=140057 RepID=A0A5M6IAI6_9PROT|nr:glycerol-3-phosphate dehydrogenase [Roseospira marina]KAA5605213.1 glycerol-3-phosphate dehydrogenase [Roseospira marina]MBB4314668.1 glycerol-3-phosphate dehydrogenase [Roseospira marina]MBB5087657.1 glycerol-3-phosphate dehydrogenase [Roseospira marina]